MNSFTVCPWGLALFLGKPDLISIIEVLKGAVGVSEGLALNYSDILGFNIKKPPFSTTSSINGSSYD